MADITAILNAHREGVIVGPTVRSAFEAIDYATQLHGLDIEIIAVLDKGDGVTDSALAHSLGARGRILYADEGDPGQSRNRGVEAASGTCIAFLDGDDLWSYNWLANAWSFVKSRPDAICHSECNVTFGKEHNVWLHIDSEGALFDDSYLSWGNYWDALSFARREIYLKFPFKKNDLKRGFGHEDWHWNWMTYAAGIPHKPVPDTMHFKRRRSGSQMSLVAQSDAFVWPL